MTPTTNLTLVTEPGRAPHVVPAEPVTYEYVRALPDGATVDLVHVAALPSPEGRLPLLIRCTVRDGDFLHVEAVGAARTGRRHRVDRRGGRRAGLLSP